MGYPPLPPAPHQGSTGAISTAQVTAFAAARAETFLVGTAENGFLPSGPRLASTEAVLWHIWILRPAGFMQDSCGALLARGVPC